MFKNLFHKEPKVEYSIAFCDENDLSTEFGEWGNWFDSYETADHTIRMAYRQSQENRVGDGYWVAACDCWLVIKKRLVK